MRYMRKTYALDNIPYPNTPTNGLVFSHLLQLHGIGVLGWEKTFGPYVKDISQKTVLDLGCGFGSEFILFLKRKCYHPKRLIHLDANPDVFFREKSYRGVMISECAIEDLFYDWSNDIKIVADAQNIPLEDRSIDIVHQDMLFDDNPEIDKNKVFAEVERILKRGGFYITSDSGALNLENKQGRNHYPYSELDVWTPRKVYLKK